MSDKILNTPLVKSSLDRTYEMESLLVDNQV